MSLSPDQFGPLYHGTDTPGLTELNAGRGSVKYSRMSGAGWWNYVTTDREIANQYAHDASRGNPDAVPTVYQVHAHGKPDEDYDWEPDPHSGPNGWNDGPGDLDEAYDHHDNGIPVALRFSHGALRVKNSWPAEPERGY